MKVSVIMGIYNCEDTLQEALDSLYAQTFEDFEIILCDDGSTDGTRAVAERNAATHTNVRLICHPTNQGLSVALNHCLQLATGEYIARMDGDDWSLPERFEKEVRFLDEHKDYAFVSCPIIYYRADGSEYLRGKVLTPEPTIEEFAVTAPFCHAPMMARREAFEAIGGYCERWYCRRMEDYHLWMQFYKEGFCGYRLAEHLYAVRDEIATSNRRGFRRRLNETVVRWKVCRHLNLPLMSYRYCLKPLVLWALPHPLYMHLHRHSLGL